MIIHTPQHSTNQQTVRRDTVVLLVGWLMRIRPHPRWVVPAKHMQRWQENSPVCCLTA